MQHIKVSAEWLASQSDSDIQIVEATFFLPTMGRDARAEFDNKRISGAVFFDIDAVSDPTNPLPHMMPDEHRFSQMMQDIGLNSDQPIIVYDRSPFLSSARAWWMFRHFGHSDVGLLDGGFSAWEAIGGTTESGPQNISTGTFTASQTTQNKAILIDALAHMVSSGTNPQIIDARASDRFQGTVAEPRPGLRSGHIPGALNVPISTILTSDGRLKSEAELLHLFHAAGVDMEQPAITSCGSGVTACGLIFALTLLGKTDVTLYDGSWAEWGSTDLPLETST